MINKVTFILDDKYDGDLQDIAMKNHVWIVGSPENLTKAREFWDKNKDISYPDRGVTTTNTGSSKVELLYDYLDVIDVHHNECSTDRPWNVIEVIGIDYKIVDLAVISNILNKSNLAISPIDNGLQIIKSV